MVFALTLLVLILPLSACSGPEFKYPKPEKFDDTSLMKAPRSPNSTVIVSAVREAVNVFYVNLYPPLKKLHEIDSSCEACDEMRKALTDAQRGAQLTYIALLDAETAIRLSSPQTDTERRFAAIGKELINKMQVITALTLISLLDADAYVRAKDEKNLDQLNNENEASLKKTLEQIENMQTKILVSRTEFIRTLEQF